MMYRAFGLYISSDIELPALLTYDVDPASDIADLVIQLTQVSKQGLVAPKIIKPNSQTAPNELWFHIPGIAWFYVSNGDRICVEPEDNADMQSVCLFLLGTCIGAIMHQRNRLVIHGNAVRIGNECVIFAGMSGNGKSTLAAAFHKKGYALLSDDLAVLDERGYVQPAYPQIKIWQDAAELLDIDISQLKKIRLQLKKYAYPLSKQHFCDTPLPVKAVYILSIHNRETIDFSPIEGMDKFIPLKNQTYRSQHLDGLGLKPQHLKQCAQLANKVRVTRIIRPKQGCQLDDLIALIEEDLNKSQCVV